MWNALSGSFTRQIDIIVGFMKEQYEYLIDEYGVNLIVNREYGEKNNLHSLKLAADKISNTYIVPCDVWCSLHPLSGSKYRMVSLIFRSFMI